MVVLDSSVCGFGCYFNYCVYVVCGVTLLMVNVVIDFLLLCGLVFRGVCVA